MRFLLILMCDLTSPHILQTAAGYFFDNSWTCGYRAVQPVNNMISALTLKVRTICFYRTLFFCISQVLPTCELFGVIGQPHAMDFFPFAVYTHMTSKPRKPLVVVFAGDTGVGKSTFERALRARVLFNTIDARGVTVINGADYSNPLLISLNRASIRARVADAVKLCSRSLIIIDEIHLMAPTTLDDISDFLSSNQPVHYYVNSATKLIDVSKSIFIFTTNTGAAAIADANRSNISGLVTAMRDEFVWFSRRLDVSLFIPFLPITIGTAIEYVKILLQTSNCRTRAKYEILWSENVPAFVVSKMNPSYAGVLVNGLSQIENFVGLSVCMVVDAFHTQKNGSRYVVQIEQNRILVQQVYT